MKLLAQVVLLAFTIPHAEAVEWGTYPNCNAPAIPLEVHSWWHEPGEQHPRHVHLASCVPNARDMTGAQVSFSGQNVFHNRSLLFNSPGRQTWNRWQWDIQGVKQIVNRNDICQTAPNQMLECIYNTDMTLNADLSNFSGLRELRISPNVEHDDLGTRQFATLNYEVYLNNGKPLQHYRNNPDPRGQSWYTGFEYATVQVNYWQFFTSPTQAIPTVSGIVPLKIRHSEGNFTNTSYLFLNPDFHLYPGSHDDVTQDPTGNTKLLYKKTGLFNGTFNWNTAGLPNGIHTIYAQTEEKKASGEIHAGALKMFFNVQN